MQNNSFIGNFWRGVKGRVNAMMNDPSKKAGLSWIKIKKLKHQSAGPLRTFTLNDQKLYFVNPQEFLHTLKELFVEEIYSVPLPENPYIIDCGANIGLGTIFFKTNYPGADIVAFEPDEKNYSLLLKNLESFALKNVITHKKAIWTEDTVLNFSNEGNMGSRIEKDAAPSSVKVEAVALKNFINKKVDLLKIDIEGAEFEVLKSIQNELNLVENMFLEYHGSFAQNNELNEMLRIITNAGLSYYIKEATSVYDQPFQFKKSRKGKTFDVQLNIFCFRVKD